MIAHSKPTLNKQDFESVDRCLESGMISRNLLTSEFENKIKTYLNTEYVKVTQSGTAALVLALMALGINNKSQEVLLPTYVCENVLEAITFCGGTPVFYDNENLWISSVNQIKKKITERTSTIIVVHTLGMPVTGTAEIVALGIPVIEDVCQAFGSEVNKTKLGSLGKIGVFSFHATKCLTTGEGGALSTNDLKIAGEVEKLYKSIPGLFSFTDIQASLGISQLKRYDEFLEQRARIAEKYFQFISHQATTSFRDSYKGGTLFRFLLTIDAPFGKIKAAFYDRGIMVRKGVDDLLHRRAKLDDRNFPNAVNIFNTTVSIPIYPGLTDEEISKIISSTNDILVSYES